MRLSRANLMLVMLVSVSFGAIACLSPSSEGTKKDGAAGSGGSKAGGAAGNAGGAAGSSVGGGAGGSGGSTASGGSGGAVSSGGSTGSSRGGAGGAASGGSSAGGSGGGTAGRSGTGGVGGAAGNGGTGGTSGTTGGTGGAQRDAGADTVKDAVLADRTDSGAPDLAGPDTATAPDVIGTDAACTPSCPTAQTCVSGQCVCSSGLSACGADCIDLNTSTSHCGACPLACTTGETCNTGVCVEGGSAGATDGCGNDLAANLTLKQIAVYQSVKIPVMKDGADVAVASRNAGVLVGRDTMFRVFVTLGSGWTARELAARLTLTAADGQPVQYYSKKTLSASSVDSDLKTSFQIFVPARAVVAGLRYAVEVVECGTASGSGGQPRFPDSGDVELGMKNTSVLKVKIIPIKVGTLLPDTSVNALAGYANYLRAMYPINDVSITVGDTLSTTTPLDWSGLLDTLRSKRSTDKPATDIYYFGLVKPADTLRAYCQGSCTTGIGYVVTSASGTLSGQNRAAIGVGFADINSQETMAHELGHNHGRNHAPCSTAGTMTGIDTSYPYTNGALGTWGYDSRTQKLYDPAKSADIMGYCDNQWVSDYNYVALTSRVTTLNNVAMVYTPASTMSRWRILLADDRGPRWGIPVTEEAPAEGDPESAIVYDKTGAALTSVVVYRTELSDGFGNMFMVPEPRPGWYAVAVAGVPALPYAP